MCVRGLLTVVRKNASNFAPLPPPPPELDFEVFRLYVLRSVYVRLGMSVSDPNTVCCLNRDETNAKLLYMIQWRHTSISRKENI